jgi:hypothetical protein
VTDHASSADVLGDMFARLLPQLDERSTRLTLAAAAEALGRGGTKAVAEASGASTDRIRRGRADLAAEEDWGRTQGRRVRRPGAGRPAAEAADPGLVAALLALVEPTRRGDPVKSLSWTTLSTYHLAEELTALGHKAGPDTVARLLKANGFSLRANRKTREGSSHPDRDAQFLRIAQTADARISMGEPVISVDAKKKELVGEYKNGGREWAPKGAPVEVNSHDFPDPSVPRANPYGVYDVAANNAMVCVGTDHDTAAFAVATIGSWWDALGREEYPRASTLFMTADSGGSNGARTRAWKTGLAAFAERTGLVITVAHLPPGTSKWNKIEHRLFAQISRNWRGRPLTSYDVIVNCIANTTTAAGLEVACRLDEADYPLGVKIADKEMDRLKKEGIHVPAAWHPDWNYTIRPPAQKRNK